MAFWIDFGQMYHKLGEEASTYNKGLYTPNNPGLHLWPEYTDA